MGHGANDSDYCCKFGVVRNCFRILDGANERIKMNELGIPTWFRHLKSLPFGGFKIGARSFCELFL